MNLYVNDVIRLSTTNSKHLKWYLELVVSRKHRTEILINVCTERHHILPRCLCSEYQQTDAENLVTLTAREHYIAHLLLAKIDFPTNIKRKMLRAFTAMSIWSNRPIRARMFQSIKDEIKLLGRSKESIAKAVESNKLTRDKDKEKFNKISIRNLQKISAENHWSKKDIAEVVKGKMSEIAQHRESIKTIDQKLEIAGKISAANTGQQWITNGVADARITSADAMPTGWKFGRSTLPDKWSESRKEKRKQLDCSLTQEEKSKKYGNRASWPKEVSEAHAAKMRGRKWMNNGIVASLVCATNVEEHLAAGWKFGMLKNKE